MINIMNDGPEEPETGINGTYLLIIILIGRLITNFTVTSQKLGDS